MECKDQGKGPGKIIQGWTMKVSFVTFWVWTAFSQPERRRRALSLRSRPVTEMVPGARLSVGRGGTGKQVETSSGEQTEGQKE